MEFKRPSVMELGTIISLMLVGIVGRYLLVGFGLQPFPNFEIIMVVTFLGMMLLRPGIAFLVPLVCMVGSDLLIGNQLFVGDQMNRIVLFTYTGFMLVAFGSYLLRRPVRSAAARLSVPLVGGVVGLGIGFVLLYDVWTNIGWWYLLYPHTTQALATVFTAGAPFMLYHLLSGTITFLAIGVPVLLLATRRMALPQPVPLRRLSQVPVVCVILGLVVLSFTGTAVNVPEKSEVWLQQADATSVLVTITGDGWSVSDHLVAYQDDSALSLLQRCASAQGLSLKTTYYEAFDTVLVEGIGNDVSTASSYWQYTVNGQLPAIGAEQCAVTNGDVLVWSFESISK